jgi:hypothetical protein
LVLIEKLARNFNFMTNPKVNFSHPIYFISIFPLFHFTIIRCIHRTLKENKIQRLPLGLLDNMNSLQMLRLDSNLLECDCSVMWLVKHLKETKNQLAAYANCKTPRIMEGKNLVEMSEEELHCSEYLFLLNRMSQVEKRKNQIKY